MEVCPYCKAFDFFMTDFIVVHRHLAECSKKYLDDTLQKKERINRAEHAVNKYIGVSGDLEDRTTDLMVDLLHLAQAKGFDAWALINRVLKHYSEEKDKQ